MNICNDGGVGGVCGCYVELDLWKLIKNYLFYCVNCKILVVIYFMYISGWYCEISDCVLIEIMWECKSVEGLLYK